MGSIRRELRRRLRGRRRLRVTREGRTFLVITVGLGLAAINTGNNLLYLVLGWMLSLIVASGALSNLTLRGLRVARRAPTRVHAGRPFLMELSLENAKRRTSSYSVEVEDVVNGRPLEPGCYFLKVPPGGRQRTSYRHVFARRGLVRLEGFRLRTRFPFSLFTKSFTVAGAEELLVLPAVRPVALPGPRAQRQGDTPQQRLGRRGEFFGLREYREGDDDSRSIHWRSSARGGRLLVREMEDEAQRRVTIELDNGLADVADEAGLAALEEAVSTAASLAVAYLRVGWAVRLVARGVHVPLGVGAAQEQRVLRALALVPAVDRQVPVAGGAEPHIQVVRVGVGVGAPSTLAAPTA